MNESPSSRRSFLKRTTIAIGGAGTVAAVGTVPLSAVQAMAQDEGDEIADDAVIGEGEDDGGEADADAITAKTLREAEKLTGLPLTDDERQLMLTTVGEQVGLLSARQSLGFLPNELSPALVFQPMLPGERGPADGPLAFSEFDAGEPPDDEVALAYAPVTHLSQWLRLGKVTSTQLTSIAIARLKRIGPDLRCVVTLMEESAMREAAAADTEIAAGRWRGPLHGVPWGAKDIIDTAGVRTTWGAEPFVDRVPKSNAAVVSRLQRAGAVLVAKLSVGALAYGDVWFEGRTNNPWNLRDGSSGSSAGSAAAVAAGLCAFALGTETWGSIVSPCMACGTTGLRPTFGRVSRMGAMALCWSMDKIGPIARTVEDCMLVLAAITNRPGEPEPMRGDPSAVAMPLAFRAGAPVRGLRVGYVREDMTDSRAIDLDRAGAEACRELGCELVEVSRPKWPFEVLQIGLLAEAAAAFEELTRTNRDDELSWQAPEAWPNTFRQAWFLSAVELVQVERFRRQVMVMMAETFANHRLDAMITPSLVGPSCLITNCTGHPSLTLRCGMKPANAHGPEMPHGVTLIGRLFEEGTIAQLGMAMEALFGVWDQRPPVG